MIELREVTLSFDDKLVFDRFSLQIPSNAVTCISGASGRGKTTLLRLIARLTIPDAGVLSGLPERPAFMFQEDRLIAWLSALKNVAAVGQGSADAEYWLGALGLCDDMELLPGKMSGGMRRRVGLARALCYDGDFLLLDEPFTGLDPALTKTAADIILSRKLPAVVVTHSPMEAQLLGGRTVII